MEASDNAVLDLVQVLNTLGAVDEQVGASALGAEAPDLSGLGHVILVLLAQVSGSDLKVLTRVDLVLVDIIGQTVRHGASLHEQTVVLVRRLGQAHLGRLVDDCLTIGYDWVAHLDRDTSVILFQILQADLQMELTGTGDDVLTGLFDDTLKQ